MLRRHIHKRLLSALRDVPVVVLHGPRQAGKSTLVQSLSPEEYPGRYVTLDQLASLSASLRDPEGFLAGLGTSAIIDEIQRAPDLLLAIKADVDRNRQPGRYLLTGLANILQLPRLADSLAGRMRILELWPLSQGEIEACFEGFIDALFAESLPDQATFGFPDPQALWTDLVRRMIRGGYPPAVLSDSLERADGWFEDYLRTVLLRDVQDLSRITGIADFPRLLTIVAGRAAGLVNYAEISRNTGLNQVTTKRYLTLMDTLFLIRRIQPWFTSRVKRPIKSEKLYFGDTGLLAHVLGLDADRLVANRDLAGTLLENFVALEVMKQRTWSRTRPEVLYFRDQRGVEVDLVLEARGGRVVGVEVKAAVTVTADDFKGLRALAEAAGEHFHRGVVLYTGHEVLPMGPRLHAVPVPAIWQMQAT
ncbi:MAG TPA: ATP-binding protein [Phycisphaerae bacterium]|jgi:predicted AAA+ superfamily ATPase|nr:ATP-binding protein [Phycisphaerae bacterium]HOB74469.1 ATP-binding protein [Phycisphaerae bacterium]HOJ54297.1 ATP-binding protein [Phycisphaerae bacterium]HOL26768.1 ATP-binding protein [Phycisphaerae bacterium]HPP20654.1 ATP-binding protein [Phycisphaerae bacterium]